MRIANVDGRAAVLLDGLAVDVERASGGRLGSDVQSLYERWDDVRSFVAGLDVGSLGPDAVLGPPGDATLRSPVPMPRQVFGIGLNYRAHAAEAGLEVPSVPATFTKFPASLGGPFDDIELPAATVDWEVELVAVIGRRADRVAARDGWSHIAGLAVGQDLSERTLQFAAGAQFSLGKSYRGFGPIGPWLVTPDEFDDPDDLALGCSVDGEVVQRGRTSDLIFSIPELVAELSAVVPLLAGDVIFTGTPAGVGFTMTPPRFLAPGQVLESWIDGIGTIRNRCVSPTARGA